MMILIIHSVGLSTLIESNELIHKITNSEMGSDSRRCAMIYVRTCHVK